MKCFFSFMGGFESTLEICTWFYSKQRKGELVSDACEHNIDHWYWMQMGKYISLLTLI